MVRSLSRGQFHVTSAWDGLGPAAASVQDDPLLGEFPLPDEDRDPEYPSTVVPDDALDGQPEPPATPFETLSEEARAAPVPALDRPPDGPTAAAAQGAPTSAQGSRLVAVEPPQDRPLESGPVTLELLEPPPDAGDTAPDRVASNPAEDGGPTHPPTSGRRVEPESTAPPSSSSPPGSDSAPRAAGSASPGPAVGPDTAVPATPAGVDPSRTLVGLLARMWLMRSSGPTSGALASAPTTPPPSPTAATALAKGVASTALAPLRPSTPVPPTPEAPRTPTAPPVLPAPPVAPQPPSRPAESPAPPLAGPADLDDRWPLSGVGTFLVEVAGLTSPPGPTAPASPLPPPAASSASPPQTPPAPLPRARIIFQLVHCPHPIPEQPASRSSCRQRRIGES